MFYIVNSLITEEGRQTFSLLGITEDKQQAAALAAEVYKDYNKNASFQNIEMITEWLAAASTPSARTRSTDCSWPSRKQENSTSCFPLRQGWYSLPPLRRRNWPAA